MNEEKGNKETRARPSSDSNAEREREDAGGGSGAGSRRASHSAGGAVRAETGG